MNFVGQGTPEKAPELNWKLLVNLSSMKRVYNIGSKAKLLLSNFLL